MPNFFNQEQVRVWCNNNNEWEKDKCIVFQDGSVLHCNKNIILRHDTHVAFISVTDHLKIIKRIYSDLSVYTGNVVKAIEPIVNKNCEVLNELKGV